MRSCSQTSLSSGRASEARRSWASCSRLKLPNHSSNWLHRLLEAGLFLVLDAAAHELLAELVVVLGELLLHLGDLVRLDRHRQVGQLGQRLEGQQLGARLDVAVVGQQFFLGDIAVAQLALHLGQQAGVVAQLGRAVPLEQVVDVFLDPVGLIAVEVEVSVQPPVQQRVAVVVGEADRAAGLRQGPSAPPETAGAALVE
jgi:hypothetical protein